VASAAPEVPEVDAPLVGILGDPLGQRDRLVEELRAA
jgi:hypothetical protein